VNNLTVELIRQFCDGVNNMTVELIRQFSGEQHDSIFGQTV